MSALIAAVRDNSLLKCRLLLETGANANTEQNGWTPLMMAADRGSILALKMLLFAGARPKGEKGSLALLMACNSQRSNGVSESTAVKVVRMLLYYGATPNPKDVSWSLVMTRADENCAGKVGRVLKAYFGGTTLMRECYDTEREFEKR